MIGPPPTLAAALVDDPGRDASRRAVRHRDGTPEDKVAIWLPDRPEHGRKH